MKTINLAVLLSAVLLIPVSCRFDQREILYTGTNAIRGSEGLYVYTYDRRENTFLLVQTLPQVTAPNFLTIAPSGEYLYTVNAMEAEGGKRVSGVSAFRIEPSSGLLELLNQVPAHGGGACHIATDREGDYLYVSHYGSGSLTVFGIHDDGRVSDSVQTIAFEGSSVTDRQKGSHLHSVLVSRDNRFAYAADLGTDRIMIFERDQVSGRLTPAAMPFAESLPGSGPRHFTFNDEGSLLYLAEELSCAVTVFAVDLVSGALERLQTLSTLPEGFDAWNTVADIHLAPDGQSLFVSNRGHNSLAVFSVQEDGLLKAAGHTPVEGAHPRNFMVDPKGEFVLVANRDTDNIVQMRLGAEPGILTAGSTMMEVPAPICLKWLIVQ
ncbi:MAG: lactonase family protein [Bacteroidales bacterium]|nr:lactonase family protein [Bacteroidales bacterium]